MEEFLTVEDLKKLFHIGNDKAYKLCTMKDFPAFRLGEGPWLIDPKELDKWVGKVIKTKTKSVSFEMVTAFSPSSYSTSDYSDEELRQIRECLTPDYD